MHFPKWYIPIGAATLVTSVIMVVQLEIMCVSFNLSQEDSIQLSQRWLESHTRGWRSARCMSVWSDSISLSKEAIDPSVFGLWIGRCLPLALVKCPGTSGSLPLLLSGVGGRALPHNFQRERRRGPSWYLGLHHILHRSRHWHWGCFALEVDDHGAHIPAHIIKTITWPLSRLPTCSIDMEMRIRSLAYLAGCLADYAMSFNWALAVSAASFTVSASFSALWRGGFTGLVCILCSFFGQESHCRGKMFQNSDMITSARRDVEDEDGGVYCQCKFVVSMWAFPLHIGMSWLRERVVWVKVCHAYLGVSCCVMQWGCVFRLSFSRLHCAGHRMYVARKKRGLRD